MDIMTKVRVLWEKVAGLENKEAATAATLADILPRIPADYSTNEVDTGVKWVDGKTIFKKTFIIDPDPEATGIVTKNIENIPDIDSVINFIFNPGTTENTKNRIIYGYYSSNNYSGAVINTDNNSISIRVTVSSDREFSGANITIYYTKPDPVPGALDKGTGMITGEDSEVYRETNSSAPFVEPEQETKTTKRKTTKKEDK